MALLELQPIAESEFAAFLEATLPSYSSARAVADHVTLAAAEPVARAQQARLLFDGFHTPGHRFYWIRCEGSSVGSLWLSFDPEAGEAYIYDIVIFEGQRRRGYASEALRTAEEIARTEGCQRIGLNVFAPNEIAQALYRRLGYAVASLYMNKPL